MPRYRAGTATVKCACCQSDQFTKDYRQLNSRAATFFNLDWANRNATILVCHRCSHIMWFLDDLKEE